MTQQTETDALDIDQLQLDRLNFKKWWHLEKQRADKLEGDNASLYAELEELRARTPEAVKVERIEGLDEALAMSYVEAAQYYELYSGSKEKQDLYVQARNALQSVWEAARRYAAMTGKGE